MSEELGLGDLKVSYTLSLIGFFLFNEISLSISLFCCCTFAFANSLFMFFFSVTSSSGFHRIFDGMLDAFTIQQQQFDKKYDLLEKRFLAQQRRDVHLLRQLQLISPPQIIESVPNPFHIFVSVSSPSPVPASTTAFLSPSVPPIAPSHVPSHNLRRAYQLELTESIASLLYQEPRF